MSIPESLIPVGADATACARGDIVSTIASARAGRTGTPTWFLASGEKHVCAMPMAQLVPLLDAAARSKAARGAGKTT